MKQIKELKAIRMEWIGLDWIGQIMIKLYALKKNRSKQITQIILKH